MPPTSSAPPARFHGLDTLRALAILLVMCFHLQPYLPAALAPVARVGWIGVDLFFVLSGFLIGSQLLKPYLRGDKPSLREFYVRRAWRILPAYVVVLSLYLLWPLWREAPGPVAPGQYWTFTWNLVMAGYPEARAFSHVWSLCVEEHFYLVLPVLVLVGMRRPSARRTALLLGSIVVAGVLLRAGLLYGVVRRQAEPELWASFMRWIYYPTYTRLDGLVAGVALALVRSFRPGWWAHAGRRPNTMLVGGLVAVGGALWLFGGDYPSAYLPAGVLWGFPLLALGFGLLVASCAAGRGWMTRRVPGAGGLAVLAYSLYSRISPWCMDFGRPCLGSQASPTGEPLASMRSAACWPRDCCMDWWSGRA